MKHSCPICIYGTGFRAKFLYHYLNIEEKDVYAFVTTRRENRDLLYDIPVKQIWDMVKTTNLKHFIFVIAVQEKYWTEIKKTLAALGVSLENVYCLDYRSILADEEAVKELIEDTGVYRKLQDEKSRIIWRQGVKYRLTNDYSYFLQDLAFYFERSDCIQYNHSINLAEWLANAHHREGKNIGLYVPSNWWLNTSYPRFKEMGIEIDCICMENEKLCNRLAYGVPVISLQRAAEYLSNGWLIIGSGMKQFTKEIKERVLLYGFEEQKIVTPCSPKQPFAYGTQYFDLQEFEVGEEEVFVDAGCLDCATDLDFIEWCGGHYKHIYAFEPDRKSYEKCLEVAREKGIDNITIVNKGLWDCEEKLYFSHNDNSALSQIVDKGTDEISVISLDDYLHMDRASFIKMDIEGAELKALKGAENIIKTYKPKLAISIYHKVNDFIDIPEYLLSIVPEYKFYVRHYSCYKYETILYAMI